MKKNITWLAFLGSGSKFVNWKSIRSDSADLVNLLIDGFGLSDLERLDLKWLKVGSFSKDLEYLLESPFELNFVRSSDLEYLDSEPFRSNFVLSSDLEPR